MFAMNIHCDNPLPKGSVYLYKTFPRNRDPKQYVQYSLSAQVFLTKVFIDVREHFTGTTSEISLERNFTILL